MYKIIRLKKKNGKFRIIVKQGKLKKKLKYFVEAMNELKEFFNEIKSESIMLSPIENALSHSQARYIINIDIKNFFNSVGLKQIKDGLKPILYGFEDILKENVRKIQDERFNKLIEITKRLRYPKSIFSGLIFKEHLHFIEHHFDTKGSILSSIRANVIFLRDWLGFVPYQGLSPSPYIALIAGIAIDNLILKQKPDTINYTRYIDDMTFSGNNLEELKSFVDHITNEILEKTYFIVNNAKTTITDTTQRRAEITGWYVAGDGKVYLNRKKRRIIRACKNNLDVFKKLLFKSIILKADNNVILKLYLLTYIYSMKYNGYKQLLKYHGVSSI